MSYDARTANPKTRTEGRRPELTTNQSRKATRAQGEGLSFLTKAHPTEVEGMTSLVPGLSVTRNVSAACFHMPVPVAPSARYSSCFRAACRINPRSIFRQSPVHILKILSPLRSIQKPGIEASRLVYLEAGCLAVALLQGCGIRRSRRFRSRRLVANHLRRAKASGTYTPSLPRAPTLCPIF